MSINSSATTNVTGEASDSNSGNSRFLGKRPRHDHSNVSASTFKGVVGQPNGHWGAQIYANHQRIWLGTFKSEKEAAMAYDSAGIKLRSGDSYRNFPWTNITAQELNFQSQFSPEALLNMIKDGSYPSKFADYLRVKVQMGETGVGRDLAPLHGNGGFLCRQLFQKELTPSDVGKLNRLVIPKKNALKYFPHISDSTEENEAGGEVDDMQLLFYDRSMRSWEFRYCYWKSSQSFVFTRGWNKFVKEKELKAKDMVIFSLCECRDGTHEVSTFCMIDVGYCDRVESNRSAVEEINEDAKLDLGENVVDRKDDEEYKEGVQQLDPGENIESSDEPKEDKELMGAESMHAQKKGFKLFGVDLI